MEQRRFVQVEMSEALVSFAASKHISARALVYRLMAVCEESEEMQALVMQVSPGRLPSTAIRNDVRRTTARQPTETGAPSGPRPSSAAQRERMVWLERYDSTPQGRNTLRSPRGQQWLAGTHTMSGTPMNPPARPLQWIDYAKDADDSESI